MSLSRRTVLKVGLGVAAASAAPSLFAQPAAATGRAVSANGWPVGDAHIVTSLVEGSPARVAVRSGYPATILTHVARRFHYEVRPLDHGVDGYRRPAEGDAGPVTNRSSGTAIVIDPTAFPPGVSGGLYPVELTVVRDILAECEGVVWWGGDDGSSPSEGHFQIDLPPDDPAVRRVARALGGADEAGLGAGHGAELVFTPDRLRLARATHVQQRRTGGRTRKP